MTRQRCMNWRTNTAFRPNASVRSKRVRLPSSRAFCRPRSEARERDLHAPVLGPAFGGCIAGERIVRSRAARMQPWRGNSLGREPVAQCLGASRRKTLIRAVATDVVGVDQDL